MKKEDLFDFLEEKAKLFEQKDFIENDPISIPHQFSRKEDIEIIAFIVATISWGNRKSIITNGNKLVEIMGESPYDFTMSGSNKQLQKIKFVHRTFNDLDLLQFILSLKKIYEKGGLEKSFKGKKALERIINFRKEFTSHFVENRTMKHVSDPSSNSSAKRLNMFLRWMVRSDKRKVDFGIWKSISPSELMLPLDVHTGNVGRKLGLLKREQNDWRAVQEITESLRKFDKKDPIKYDFALFGLGAVEKF
jgi:uncharacterized protein (TIGR02757 family)